MWGDLIIVTILYDEKIVKKIKTDPLNFSEFEKFKIEDWEENQDQRFITKFRLEHKDRVEENDPTIWIEVLNPAY